MIDFHNHILPGVDDGARDVAQSLYMLKYAQDQGVTDVVNTIHFQHPKMEGKNTDYNYICDIKQNLELELKKNNIQINIHLGAEVFFNFNLLEIIDNPLVTFNNGKYMLIEFQPFLLPDGYDKHLYELKMSGITPIIAHPERYKAFQEDSDIARRLIDSGCLIQIDAGSIIGTFGKKPFITAINLLKSNMCHILGSDAHNDRRNFCLKEALKKIDNIIGVSYDYLVNKNPSDVLMGNEVIVPEINDLDSNNWFKSFIDLLKK